MENISFVMIEQCITLTFITVHVLPLSGTPLLSLATPEMINKKLNFIKIIKLFWLIQYYKLRFIKKLCKITFFY